VAKKKVDDAVVELVVEKVKKIIDGTLLPTLIQKTNAHERLLNGNGKPGIQQVLAVHGEKLEKIEASMGKFESFVVESRIHDQTVRDAITRLTETIGVSAEETKKSIKELKESLSSVIAWKTKLTINIGIVVAVAMSLGGFLGVVIQGNAENLKSWFR
jgi:hypothetical protein